jgi:cellulose synthase/poly-beta-1,6-N-acetylglucosamine synthase-like glycosyltransferase
MVKKISFIFRSQFGYFVYQTFYLLRPLQLICEPLAHMQIKNPLSNKNYINHLKLLVILLIIMFNLLLTYILMWNPYTLFFKRPELSNINFETRDYYSSIIALVNFILLFGLTIVTIIKFWKTKRIFWITPLFSGATLFLLLHVQKYYPDADSRYTKNGYIYLEQSWYMNGRNTFKRFKSEQPSHKYSNDQTIIWHLDSISEK